MNIPFVLFEKTTILSSIFLRLIETYPQTVRSEDVLQTKTNLNEIPFVLEGGVGVTVRTFVRTPSFERVLLSKLAQVTECGY